MAKKDETQMENTVIQEDECEVTAKVDPADTNEAIEVAAPDATAEVDEVEEDTIESTSENGTENGSNDSIDDDSTDKDESTEEDSEHTESETESVDSVERKVMHTNRLMKVYAHPNTKSRMYTFVGTYTITGKVSGKFKEIVCSVAGIGKFRGYIAL